MNELGNASRRGEGSTHQLPSLGTARSLGQGAAMEEGQQAGEQQRPIVASFHDLRLSRLVRLPLLGNGGLRKDLPVVRSPLSGRHKTHATRRTD